MDMRPLIWANANDARKLNRLVNLLKIAGLPNAIQNLQDFTSGEGYLSAPWQANEWGDAGNHTFGASYSDEAGCLMMFSGITDSTKVTSLIRDWSNPVAEPFNSGLDRCYQEGWAEIIQIVGLNRIINRQLYQFVGHSYGCGLALAAAKTVKTLYPQSIVQLTLFGSPRLGTSNFIRLCAGIDCSRIFLDTDPVRFLPSWTNEAPWMHTVLSGNASNNWNIHAHIGTGVQVTAGGILTWTEGGIGALQCVTPNLLNLIAGTDYLGNSRHLIQAYVDAFGSAVNLIPPPAPPQPAPRPVPPPPMNRPQINVMQQLGQDQLDALPPNPAAAIAIAQTAQTAPGAAPAARYRRRRLGRGWGVVYMAQIVMAGLTKRAAGRWARSLNRTLTTRAR